MQYIDVCKGALIKAHLVILQSEFARLLEVKDEKNLKALYALLSRVKEGLSSLPDIFCEHIKKEGQAAMAAIVSGKEDKDTDATDYVNNLALVHERFWALAKRCLNDDKAFLTSVDKVSSCIPL
jgi:hypothetical protein